MDVYERVVKSVQDALDANDGWYRVRSGKLYRANGVPGNWEVREADGKVLIVGRQYRDRRFYGPAWVRANAAYVKYGSV